MIKIHTIVSVTQLELAKGFNLFERKKPNYSGSVEIETTAPDGVHNKLPLNDSYKVEQITDKQLWRYGRTKPKTEYQVKWINYRLK